MRAVDDLTCGTWSPEAFLLLADVAVGRGLPEHVMSWTIEKDVFDVDSAGATAKSPPLSSGVVGGLRALVTEVDTVVLCGEANDEPDGRWPLLQLETGALTR